MFGRDFLVTTKCKLDVALGEMRIDITELKEEKEVEVMLAELCDNIEEVRDEKVEVVKMGKANRKKTTLNKLTRPSTSKSEDSTSSPPIPPPTFTPLTHEKKKLS